MELSTFYDRVKLACLSVNLRVEDLNPDRALPHATFGSLTGILSGVKRGLDAKIMSTAYQPH
jgi:hypothetical protein